MGRITIFTVDDCFHCVRLLTALNDNDIPYKEISLSLYPKRRPDMLGLSDRLTVPQVFFNDKHVGGADDTLAVLEEWISTSAVSDPSLSDNSESSSNKSVLQHYQEQVGDLPDPADPRLTPALLSPHHHSNNGTGSSTPAEGRKRHRSDRIKVPIGNGAFSSWSVLKTTEKLKSTLPCQSNKTKKAVFKQSFTGQEAVKVLKEEFDLDEAEAIKFGEYLLKHQIFHALAVEPPAPAPTPQPLDQTPDSSSNTNASSSSSSPSKSSDFQNSSKAIYRLQCYHTPHILNSYRIWNPKTGSDPDFMTTLQRLKRLLDQVEKQVTCSKTGQVNYALVSQQDNWSRFEEAVCELQTVDLMLDITDDDADMTEDETEKDDQTQTLKAFGINLYNLMIKYAFMKVGVTHGAGARSAFFNGVKFQVGPFVYSFQDWEHGVLRGNRKAPYSLSKQFAKDDPRRVLANAIVGGSARGGGGGGGGSGGGVDCRIHFALNCGARSCPPIRTFHADGIEEELRIVSQAFCEDDENVEINVEKRSMSLNKILGWYRGDFCPSEAKLPAALLPYLRGEKRQQLQQLLDDGKPIAISYKTYDWSTDATEDTQSFESTALRADKQRLAGWFSLSSLRNKKKMSRSSSMDPSSSPSLSPSRKTSKRNKKKVRRGVSFDEQLKSSTTSSNAASTSGGSDTLGLMKDLKRSIVKSSPIRIMRPSTKQSRRRSSMDVSSGSNTSRSFTTSEPSSSLGMDTSLAQLEELVIRLNSKGEKERNEILFESIQRRRRQSQQLQPF